MIMRCRVCGLEMKSDEIHSHIPDFFLDIQNMQYSLFRSFLKDDHIIEIEGLDFNIPDHWAQWVLDSCGGALDISGRYRLPGLLWEWVISVTSEDKRKSDLLYDRIEEHLSYHLA